MSTPDTQILNLLKKYSDGEKLTRRQLTLLSKYGVSTTDTKRSLNFDIIADKLGLPVPQILTRIGAARMTSMKSENSYFSLPLRSSKTASNGRRGLFVAGKSAGPRQSR